MQRFRGIGFLFVLAALILTALLPMRANADAPPLANDVIFIIRHAEKPDSGSGLTPTGQQRAAAYVRYFQDDPLSAKPLHLDALIATADTGKSRRPRLTVEPLSAALHLATDTRFHDQDVSMLAAALRSQSGGKTVLICWHHGEIPALLQTLGADPNVLLPHGTWPPDTYDWVIRVQYDRNGHLLPGQSKRINEHLLPGDAD